jgi:hypothetical protein
MFSNSSRQQLRAGVALTGLILSGFVLDASAQTAATPVPGFQHDQAYVGALPFEHIDTASGNLLLTFTDLSLPGYNGMDLVVQRTYNSATANGIPGMGWTYGLARFPYRVRRPDGPPAPGPNISTDFHDPARLPEVLTPDGGSHRTWWAGGDMYSPHNVFVTADFWQYHTQQRRLELPDGVQCFYDDVGLLFRVVDRFSNSLDLVWENPGVYTGRLSQITQNLGDGRARVVTFAHDGGILPKTMTYEGRVWTYDTVGEYLESSL